MHWLGGCGGDEEIIDTALQLTARFLEKKPTP
jgi:hypothetical protein